MQKIQILFPEPVLARIRKISKLEDRPLSEIIRKAVDRYLTSLPTEINTKINKSEMPVFAAGEVLIEADSLKEILYK